jgi:hypothetical protein
MAFFLGSIVGFVAAIVCVLAYDRRVDRDIEARLMALDKERVRRVFARHANPCDRCGGRGFSSFDEAAAVRDTEWSSGGPL